MKANELRLGNYVDITRMVGEVRIPTGRTFKTVGVSMFNSSLVAATVNPATEEHWPNYANTHIEPIPLTEDWLEKFGFFNKYKSVHCHWHKCYGEGPPYRIFELPQISNVDDDNNIIPQEQIWYYDGKLDVIYVHQLQNLYYAVTGEELEVKSTN